MKKSRKLLGVLLASCMFLGACDDAESNIAENHVHSFGEWEIKKDATCKEPGKKERKCTGCDEVESEEIAKLTTHTYGDWVETPATCKDDGKKERVCTVCGNKETETLPKITTHTFGDWEETPATCKDDGKKERVCTVCGEKETEILPKTTEHNFVDAADQTGAVEPTCKEDGVVITECSVCGIKSTRVAPKLETHSFSSWAYVVADNKVERTCYVCGEKEEEDVTVPEQTWTAEEQAVIDQYYFGANIPWYEFEQELPLAYYSQYGEALKNALPCSAEILDEYAKMFDANWECEIDTSNGLDYRLEGIILTENGKRRVTVEMYGINNGNMTADGSGTFCMEVYNAYAYTFENSNANYVIQNYYASKYALPDLGCDFYQYSSKNLSNGQFVVYGLADSYVIMDLTIAFVRAMLANGYYNTGRTSQLGWPIFASIDDEVEVEIRYIPDYGIIALFINNLPDAPVVNGDKLDAAAFQIPEDASGYNDYACVGASGAEYKAVASATNGFGINKGNGHGIVVTKSVGTVNAVKVVFADSTEDSVAIEVYASNDPFDVDDMFDPDNAKGLFEIGTLIVDRDFVAQLTFETEYAYIGFKVTGGTAYIEEVVVSWTIPTPPENPDDPADPADPADPTNPDDPADPADPEDPGNGNN